MIASVVATLSGNAPLWAGVIAFTLLQGVALTAGSWRYMTDRKTEADAAKAEADAAKASAKAREDAAAAREAAANERETSAGRRETAAIAARDAAIAARDALAADFATRVEAEAQDRFLRWQRREAKDLSEQIAEFGDVNLGGGRLRFIPKVTAETAPCQDAPGDDVTGTPPGESDV